MTRRALPLLDDPSDALPPLQARWLAGVFDAALPREVEATCDDCAMLEGAGLRFFPETRCCTFLPTLANFLAGGALRDGGFGARSVRARIADGHGVSPLGLVVDPGVAGARVDPERFGRDPSARCPHFVTETGRCGVWRWREATCATWFCKHTRGARSKALWHRAHQLLARIERAVAWHAAVSLDIPAEGLAAMTPLDAGRADVLRGPVDRDGLWGRWAPRVEDFYRAAVELAESLSPREALALAGPEALASLAALRLGVEGLPTRALPDRITLGDARVVALSADAVTVQGYSHLDPLRVPRALFDQLHHFDGRPGDEALREASRAAGEEVPADAIAMLLEWEILRAQ